MVTSMPKRCALYIRVSTCQQVDNGNSLVTQKVQLIQYARESGYTVCDIYCEGLSARNTKRPELQQLLADAADRRFDMVLVWAVDRISRSLADLIRLVERLRESDVDFVSITQEFDTSDPTGRLALHILGSFAQFERELLIERTKEGHLRRLHQSDWSCGPSPFGYRKENGKLIEVAEEARVVRQIFRLFLKLKSFIGVARELNRAGIQTRRGNAWSGNTVKEIVRNPVYAGANVYGRHKKGDTRLRPRDKWVVVPGMRKPLVRPETFDKAGALTQAIPRNP
jgi:site-specific DNA recombinase